MLYFDDLTNLLTHQVNLKRYKGIKISGLKGDCFSGRSCFTRTRRRDQVHWSLNFLAVNNIVILFIGKMVAQQQSSSRLSNLDQ